jgi:restriction endonuclease S subunit
MTSRATGASYPAVSDRIVLESHIPLVPIAEQRRIADMLDRAEALRAKRRAALAQLDTLAQSIFLDMFGDPAINPRRWPVKPLGAVTECLDSLRKPVKESDRRPGSVPYYGANGQQGWIDRPLFNEPLVLVAEDGGHFDEPERGVAYRIDGPAWVNNHAHILRPRGDALEIEYLHRALRYYDFRLFVSGTTRAKLTQQQLNSATIMAPPLALQRNFADRLLAVKALQATQSRSLNALDSLFASLQHRAFRGEL